MFLFLYVCVLECWPLPHSEYICTLQYVLRFLLSVSLPRYHASSIEYCHLLHYNGAHIIKTDYFTEFCNLGSYWNYLISSIINDSSGIRFICLQSPVMIL